MAKKEAKAAPSPAAEAAKRFEIETVEADLGSTYEWPSGSGKLYGPGTRILVPQGLADLLNVKKPKSAEGWNPASNVESRSDADHPAVGFQGAGVKEGRQK